MSERKILAIDWDSRGVRFVHAGVRKDKVRIDRLFAHDVPEGLDISDPESLGRFIRAVLDDQRIKTDRVLLDVPRDQALLTTLDLPATTADEMPALVEFQIAKEIPFPLAAAVVDFAMPSDGDGPRVDVLVGTVRREIVGYYERVCAAASLKLERLGLRPYANKVAVNEVIGPARYACVAMVDVGPRLTEIDVIADGQLAFSRAASVSVPRRDSPGSDSLHSDSSLSVPEDSDGSAIIQFPTQGAGESQSGTDRVVSALLVEVTRTIEAYRSASPGSEIGMFVVGGATGVEGKLAEVIGKRFGTSVELYNPARRFGWPDDRGQDARGYSAALGLVCGHAAEGRLHFDFLHPKKTVTATERRLRKAPAFVVAAAVVVIGLICLYVFGIAPKKKALAAAEAEIEQFEEDIKALRKIEDKIIGAADAFEEEQVIWIDELMRISQKMPDSKQIVLKRLDMRHKSSRLSFQFESASRDVALDTVKRLDEIRVGDKDTQHLEASLKSTKNTPRGRQYQTSGSIDVTVKGKAAK